MGYLSFLKQMNHQIILNQVVTKKHIIRFTCKREFNQCTSLIKKMMPKFSKLAAIQTIQSINAICCSLHSVKALSKNKGILFIEEDIKVLVHGFSGKFPPFYQQRILQRDHSTIPWGVNEIKSPQAWKKTEGNRIKIGVIDTGVDFAHPDLRSSLAGGVNMIQKQRPAYDDNGHGTHITGTIAANNRTSGIVGVAPKAAIYAVKAFDKNGSAFVSDIIQGIEWCIQNKMNIINMSFGMKNRSLSLRDAIRQAHAARIIVTASSGNEGKASGIDYPARFNETIAVGSTDKNKQISSFSNRGKGINIYAPGDKIYSTWLNNGYNTISGTSMATSHVSGAIALLLSLKPKLTIRAVKALIKRSATPLKNKTSHSIGEVNVFKAINSK